MIGTHVSHYQITKKIGEGGMGEVYRALDTKLNRDIGMKIPSFPAQSALLLKEISKIKQFHYPFQRRPVMKTIPALICLCFLLLSVSLIAENVKMKDNPKCKQWHSIIGEWTHEVEYRNSPTDQWKKGSAKHQIEWALGGAAIQIRAEDYQTSGISMFVYENRLDAHVGGGYSADGSRWVLNAGDWDGLNWTGNWTAYPSEGKAFIGHCTFNYDPDFTSATVECQQFTNGQSWTDRKIKAKKTK